MTKSARLLVSAIASLHAIRDRLEILTAADSWPEDREERKEATALLDSLCGLLGHAYAVHLDYDFIREIEEVEGRYAEAEKNWLEARRDRQLRRLWKSQIPCWEVDSLQPSGNI